MNVVTRQNIKKSKKIQFAIFINKSLKNQNAKNICHRAFCLAPNEKELSNLLTRSKNEGLERGKPRVAAKFLVNLRSC